MTRASSAVGGLAAVLAAVAGVGGFSAAFAQAGPRPPQPAGVSVTKRPYDTKALASAPVPASGAYRGRTVWLQRCAYCHDGVGQPSYQTLGPWLGAETLTKYGEEGVRAFIAAGTERMPGFQYALKPAQVNDLIAFLKTIPSAAKPTPDQLAGRGPGGLVSND